MSNTISNKQGQFIYPGERIAVIEELLDGAGSYTQEGIVRSEELGCVNIDLNNRRANIQKITRDLVRPQEGLKIIGEVGSVQRRSANVDMFKINGVDVTPPYTGLIHSSSVGYNAKNLGSAVRSGDIIKALIVNTKNRLVQLSIEGAEYGVIYAYCSKCGELLERRKTRLHCSRCGRVERREIAKSYGQEILI